LAADRPCAVDDRSLGSSEIEPLAQLINRLHGEEKLTILLIEHKLRDFMALVSRVIAIDFGEIIAVAAVCTENLIRVDEVMESPKLAE
jgi:branched-chain amino acid transport system ATP-binding protein